MLYATSPIATMKIVIWNIIRIQQLKHWKYKKNAYNYIWNSQIILLLDPSQKQKYHENDLKIVQNQDKSRHWLQILKFWNRNRSKPSLQHAKTVDETWNKTNLEKYYVTSWLVCFDISTYHRLEHSKPSTGTSKISSAKSQHQWIHITYTWFSMDFCKFISTLKPHNRGI